jgi:hypothetical protein
MLRTIPSSTIRTIPSAPKKENIHIDIGRIINIGSRYHDKSRRSGYHQSGKGDRDVDIHLGTARSRDEETAQENQDACI